MLIDTGRIEVFAQGSALKFVHRDVNGEARRYLEKQHYMSAKAWKQAIEAWLSNYHENMPLRRPDGTTTTVAEYEGTFV